MAGLPKEIYCVVSEYDNYMGGVPEGSPIVFESSNFDKISADLFAKRLNGRYGRTAVYKCVLEHEVWLDKKD